MIQFDKETTGDLLIRISPDDVGEELDIIQSANLQQHRVFNPLKDYIKGQYVDDLLAHKNITRQ